MTSDGDECWNSMRHSEALSMDGGAVVAEDVVRQRNTMIPTYELLLESESFLNMKRQDRTGDT